MDLSRLTDAQLKSVLCTDSALLVCAGAGSGKTFTLTQRIAHAFTGDNPVIDDVNQLLVITFTDKAASEIKARVKRVLRREGLVDQALLVDAAWISTIHSMCARILRAYAFELGIDPDFELLNDSRYNALLYAAIDSVLKEQSAFRSHPDDNLS